MASGADRLGLAARYGKRPLLEGVSIGNFVLAHGEALRSRAFRQQTRVSEEDTAQKTATSPYLLDRRGLDEGAG